MGIVGEMLFILRTEIRADPKEALQYGARDIASLVGERKLDRRNRFQSNQVPFSQQRQRGRRIRKLRKEWQSDRTDRADGIIQHGRAPFGVGEVPFSPARDGLKVADLAAGECIA